MRSSDKASDYDFKIIDKWGGYVSSVDKTTIAENFFVQGSKNVYKKLSGTIAVRQGQKRQGEANSTESPVSSEYVWNTSWGATLPVWVSDSKLQVRYNDVWYTLQSGLTKTRYVFDKWYDKTQAKDSLLFVNGTSNLYQWTGGIMDVVSGTNNSGCVTLLGDTLTNAGSGYTIGDVITITTGGTGATAEVTKLGTGAVLTVSIPAGLGGLYYKVGDVLQVQNGNNGTGATFTVSTIGANGVITAITITTGGLGYFTSVYRTVGGSGFGAFISIDSVATSGSITGLKLLTPGSGYTTGTGKATSGGTGTGATVNIVSIATGTILGSKDFRLSGFSQSGVINVGGTEYTYTDAIGLYLVGVSPNPSAIVPGIAFQTIKTIPSTPSAGFNSDFLKVINNQVYIGSYTSRLCYISSNTDYTNYIVPIPRAPGDPELLTLDATLKGIGVRKGTAHIGFGTDSWAVITFNNITVGSTLTQQTVVDVKPVAILQAPYAHEFIDTVGDSLVYLAQDQQVRSFGDFNNLFTPGYPSFSQAIATELEAENFTGGALKCIGEFTYITAPNTGNVYLYQVRTLVDDTGQIVAERLWHAPFVWNCTRIDEINGVVVGFSNSNPQVYELWDTGQWYDDSPSDEPLPYECVLALGYRTLNRRQGLQSFDKLFSEGYITRGTPLNLTINYNYNGATEQITKIVNSVAQPATLFNQSFVSLGDASLGDNPLGDGETTDEMLQKFKCINSLTLINCFEYQPVFYSDTTNAQWEILAVGTNSGIEAEQQATFLVNKIRPI